MTSRFALLIHDLPELHLDLMLGREEVLWTWRLNRWPDPSVWTAAERISDHRTAYLDYEGAISSNRGTVRRVLQGHVTWLEEGPTIRLRAHYAGRDLFWEMRPLIAQGEASREDRACWQFRSLA